MMKSIVESVKWNEQGLVAAIAQDVKTKKVLMMAWMNPTSLEQTIVSQKATYWSRSRQKLWVKGESSGHTQKVHDIRLDCDGDTILLMVEQIGGIACHTGREHCFYLGLSDDKASWQSVEPILKSADDIYNQSN